MAVSLDSVEYRYDMVCLHNRNDTYYLPFAALENSGQTDGNSSFFYRLIASSPSTNNTTFGNFCWMHNDTPRGLGYTADVYLNVDPEALNLINDYVQRDLLPTEISSILLRTTIDLAAIMGMPTLVASLRRIVALQANDNDY